LALLDAIMNTIDCAKLSMKKMQIENSHDNGLFLFLCCIVLLVGTAISALANIQFKLDASSRVKHDSSFLHSRRYFLLGILLSIVAGIADMFVIGHIPFIIRCCFSGLGIPIGVLLARIILNERIEEPQLLGVLMTMVGSTGGVLTTGEGTSGSNQGGSLLWLLSSSFVIVPTVIVGIRELSSQLSSVNGRMKSLCLCAYTVSFVAACSTISARLASWAISASGFLDAYALSILSVCIIVSVLQMSLVAKLLQKFTAVESVPAYQIFNIGWLVFSGAIFFNEAPNNPLLFGSSLLVSAVGIWLIARGSSNKEPLATTVTDKRYMYAPSSYTPIQYEIFSNTIYIMIFQ